MALSGSSEPAVEKWKKIPVDAVLVFHPGFFFFFKLQVFSASLLETFDFLEALRRMAVCPRVPQDPYWSHPLLMTGCFSRLG